MGNLIKKLKKHKYSYKSVIKELYNYGYVTKEIIINLKWNKVVLNGNDFRCIIFYDERFSDSFEFEDSGKIEDINFIKIEEEK